MSAVQVDTTPRGPLGRAQHELTMALDHLADSRNTLDEFMFAFPAGEEPPKLYTEMCSWLIMVRMALLKVEEELARVEKPAKVAPALARKRGSR
jgi:hypothetical protein